MSASLPENLREDRDDHADWVVVDEDVDAGIDGTRSEGPKTHKCTSLRASLV